MSFLLDAFDTYSSSIPALQEAWVADGFCAYDLPVGLDQPRGITMAPEANNLLVIERSTSKVKVLVDKDGDGVLDSSQDVVGIPKDNTGFGLTHGIAWHEGYLYASTYKIVYRWPYPKTGLDGKLIPSNQTETVIDNIVDSTAGMHRTRTLKFDKDGQLYVTVGSTGNVDDDGRATGRAQIRRFNVTDSAAFPIQFRSGEIFADGVRNTVGLAFDVHDVLWGVDNGPDALDRDDLGFDIHDDNPGEELNRFLEEDAGANYGYPQCWSEGQLPGGRGPGSQWAWPSYIFEGITDRYCRKESNNVPPEAVMPAHTAPLGITFYKYEKDLPPYCDKKEAFPKKYDGYAFVAYHGSWNRQIPTGYKVTYLKMDKDGNVDADDFEDLLKSANPESAKWTTGVRPVDVAFDRCGRLLVSSDGTNTFGVGYIGSTVAMIVAGKECVKPEELLGYESFLGNLFVRFGNTVDFIVNNPVLYFLNFWTFFNSHWFDFTNGDE